MTSVIKCNCNNVFKSACDLCKDAFCEKCVKMIDDPHGEMVYCTNCVLNIEWVQEVLYYEFYGARCTVCGQDNTEPEKYHVNGYIEYLIDENRKPKGFKCYNCFALDTIRRRQFNMLVLERIKKNAKGTQQIHYRISRLERKTSN